jgi:hypothetical protein
MNQEHKQPSFIDKYEDSPLGESTLHLELENDMSDPILILSAPNPLLTQWRYPIAAPSRWHWP